MVDGDGAAGIAVGDLLLAGDRAIAARIVDQDDDRLFLAVLEVEVDSFLGEDPRQEVEVGLVHLRAVFTLQRLGMQPRVELDVPQLEQLLGDLDHREVLEDTATLRMRELGEARDDPQMGLTLLLADRDAAREDLLHHAPHDVQRRVVIGAFHLEDDLASEGVVEPRGGLGAASDRQIVGREPGERVPAEERQDRERAVLLPLDSQRGADLIDVTEERSDVGGIYHRLGESGLRWGEVQDITTGDVAGSRPLGRPADELRGIARRCLFLSRATAARRFW